MVNSRFFRNSLILILIISSIPGIILGGMIYWFAGGRMENDLLQLHKTQIVQRAASIDEQFHLMEMSLAHWAFDSKFSNDLSNINFSRDFELSRDITKTLIAMKGANPLAKQVEMYLQTPRPVRLSPEYDVIGDEASIQSYEQLLAYDKPFYWIYWAADPNQPDLKELTLVHKIPGANSDPYGAIMIRVDEKKFSDLLSTLLPYSAEETFVMQADGEVLTPTTVDSKKAAMDQQLKQKVLQRNAREGFFIFGWKDTKYTVSFGTFTRVGTEWIYVSASPIGLATAPVVFVSKFILGVSFTVLIITAILSWLASRKIYSPVDRLVRMLAGDQRNNFGFSGQNDEFKVIEKEWQNLNRESTTLKKRLEKQLPHVKEGFLLQLLQGYLYAYSEKDLIERMRSFGWEVDDWQYIVLHIQLTGFSDLEGRFSQGDEGLVTFAAANITRELTSSHLEQADVINFHNLSIGVLIMFPAVRPYQKILQELSDDVMRTFNHILKLRVSITIGKPAASIVEIPMRYEEAKQALNYRNFKNENQVIDLEALEVQDDVSEQNYPFMLEREIIHVIRTGQQEEANTLIASFLDELCSHGAKEIDVQQCMLQLLGSILHTVRHMRMDPYRVFKSPNLYEQLTEIREPQKMLQWFNEQIVVPFVQELESRSDVIMKKTVEFALIYVQNNYMKDISLDSCAERVGMHPVVLSKSFKQVAGKNFIDYLTELRLDKAKELLQNTDLKINDIAAQIGYQQSYFNRIFKKLEGLTPSQYRETSRGNR